MIISSSFGDRCYGSYSSAFVNIYGGYTPYTYEITKSSLPAGLSLRVTGNYIYLKGIPTQNCIFNFTLRVTDKDNGYSEKEFSVIVGDTFDYSMYINSVFRDTRVGEQYSEFVYTRGKAACYTPIITKGELPLGLGLRQSMIRTYLEGTPIKAETYNFTLRVTGNNHRYTENTFTITVS